MTGLDVGPDGALYFCTGGRGTDGGIYRVRWTGTVPPQAIQFGQGIEQALHQPQLHSDWARMRVAAVKRSLGDRWQSDLQRVLADPASQPKPRLRALGSAHVSSVRRRRRNCSVRLARDADPAMRVRVARLMGAQTEPGFAQPLARDAGRLRCLGSPRRLRGDRPSNSARVSRPRSARPMR